MGSLGSKKVVEALRFHVEVDLLPRAVKAEDGLRTGLEDGSEVSDCLLGNGTEILT